MEKKIIYFLLLQFTLFRAYAQNATITDVALGIIKVSTGTIDKFSPYSFWDEKRPLSKALIKLPNAKLPFDIDAIHVDITNRVVLIEIPLDDTEQLYGFGLQISPFTPPLPQV